MQQEATSETTNPLLPSELPEPPRALSVPTAAQLAAGPRLSPRKRIWLYDSDEWEAFILEWAHAVDEPYVHVQRLGGSGDRGIDVAGFLTDRGLEGAWDCFQCKHYEGTLSPVNVWPEIVKILLAAWGKYCILPRRYLFFSPRGAGPKLAKLLNSPDDLRSTFLSEFKREDSALKKTLSPEVVEHLARYAESVDFAIFGEMPLEDVLEVHRRTCHHALRFGTELPARPLPDPPPENPTQAESRYVEQLLEVYREKYPGESFDSITVSDHSWTKIHFPRQREAFYCAESLRVFARDSLPDRTFEKLQEDLYAGVVETEELDHESGHIRLTSVLQAATQVDLSSNVLISVADPRDRKGICHQLANEDRLTWVRGDSNEPIE